MAEKLTKDGLLVGLIIEPKPTTDKVNKVDKKPTENKKKNK